MLGFNLGASEAKDCSFHRNALTAHILTVRINSMQTSVNLLTVKGKIK